MSKKAWAIPTLTLLTVCAVAGLFAGLRSLHHSAAMRPPQTISSSVMPKQAVQITPAPVIHIEGCAAYIQPPSGENLEPRMLPGASIEGFQTTYGQPGKHDKVAQSWEWENNASTLDAFANSKEESVVSSLLLESKSGRKVATPDGIVLGKDTYQTVLDKLQARGVKFREQLADEDMVWVLTVTFPSTCNSDLNSKYNWSMDDTPETDKEIGNDLPFHSRIFLDKLATSYIVERAYKGNEIIDGPPATHE
ncbi:MAG: hypothetical protein ABSD44_01970 [Terracidiphilus sp.]